MITAAATAATVWVLIADNYGIRTVEAGPFPTHTEACDYRDGDPADAYLIAEEWTAEQLADARRAAGLDA